MVKVYESEKEKKKRLEGEKKSAEKKCAEKTNVEKTSVEKTGVEKKRKYGDAISASDLEKNNPMYSDDTFLNFLS